MWNDLSLFGVLVTGGTKGLGLATALRFARAGAHVTITHKWGSVPDEELRARFAEAEATEPLIVCADAASNEDTAELMTRIAAVRDGVDVFVSNVAFAQLTKSFDDYSRRGLRSSIDYSVWPLVEQLRAIHAQFGRYPRYVIAMSSFGAESYHTNYDMAGVTKAMTEALCRYLCERLQPYGARVNAVRTRYVVTDSLVATIGEQFVDYVEGHDPSLFVDPDDVAAAILALCAGPMDAVTGQVLTIDRGTSFRDNLMGAFERHQPRE